jgi:large subunit ribosomal protein L25
MEFIQLEVEERKSLGTAKARSLRGSGKIPAVLYGLGRPNLSLTLSEHELEKFLRTGNRLVELKLSDKTRAAILREVQHDPVTDAVLHVDFVRVDKDKEVDDRVPIVWKGRPKGTSTGGVFQAIHNEIRVRCRPADLPREIVVEVTPLELDQALFAKDIPLPPNVKLLTDANDLLCHVVKPKLEVVPEAAAPVEAAEPELIRKAPVAGEEEGAEGAEKGAAKGEKAAGKAEKPGEKPEKGEKKK